MSDRYWYDKDGNYKGRSTDTSPVISFIMGTLVLLLVAGLFLTWLGKTLSGYKDYELPYNVITGFYYFLMLAPLELARSVFLSVSALGITQYKNLNSVVAFFLGFATAATPYVVAIALLRRYQLQRFVPLVLGAPIAFAIVWALSTKILSWLFA